MSLTTFPYTSESDGPNEGWEIEPDWSTQIVSARAGTEQRRQLWTLPRHRISGLSWSRQENSSTKLDALYAFYMARKGALEPFVYFDFDQYRTWTKAYVGTGTGALSTYDLPAKSGTSYSIYVNGVLQTVTTHYAITAGAGSNGRDRIVFTFNPTLGHIIEATFTGQRAFVVRFAEDKLSYRAFSVRLYEIGISLIEVKGEG